MDLDDISALKVPSAKNCVLFLWATAPKLREALKVIDSWGFEYKTHAVWDKQKIGMGYYFRGQHELLLVATKGEPGTPLPADRPSSLISIPRTGHSEKPVLVYELLEQMYPNKQYFEMFARNERSGWQAWGNQV
jgi:N6-adenosine-specific RNA methylase IME4